MATRSGGLPLILRTWLGGWWRWLLPLALLAAIWWPEWTHYRIDRSDVAAGLPEQGAALPADAVLDELADVDLAEADSLGLPAATIARQMAQGYIDLPGLSGGRVPLRGHPQDHQVGSPTFRLFMASTAPERMLLRAYEETRDEQWLNLALQRTLELAAHERAQTHDKGFLWNDHAVAGRVATLVRLWADIRARPALRQADGPALISFAQRSGRMLAKPGHFTVRTNHGVMQNLALLQLAAAFPWLPEAPQWRELARQRLSLQWPFYLSPEGVTLEHSPAYHQLGLLLVQRAQRLYRLNGLPPDPLLERQAGAAHRVLTQLLRPDGTLPPIGNTDIGRSTRLPALDARGSARPAWLPLPGADSPGGAQLYPVSGWALWWSGQAQPRESQLMVTWAKHDGHGHKHADEGALVWWAQGQEWLGAVGYWPYGDSQVRKAYGWRSANAPHTPDEDPRAARSVQLLGSGEAGGLRMLDLERRTADGTLLRRQVLQWDASTLLVLDFQAAARQGSQTLWTLGPAVRLQLAPPEPGARSLAASSLPRADGLRLGLRLAATSELRGQLLRGSRAPFGGWATVDSEPRPVDALELTSPTAEAATVGLFHLGRGEGAPGIAPLPPRLDPVQWQLALRIDDQPVQLQRSGDRLTLATAGTTQTLTLQPPPASVAEAQRTLREAYRDAVDRYPPWRDLWRYRVEISQYIGALALGLEGALLAAAALAGGLLRRWRLALQSLLLAGWGGLAAWVLLVHLQV